MSTVFRITNTDRRDQLIQASQYGTPYIGQIPSGPSVEGFHPSIGFYLVEARKAANLNVQRYKRAASVAELSQGARLGLREFYYTLRSRPELAGPFEKASEMYPAVLKSINDLEIIADIDRQYFTMGNRPAGTMFYGHDYSLGDKSKLIGLTEELAEGVSPWDITDSLNVIHLEKMSAATRLIMGDFSKYTNSIITTTGGNFTRAVYKLAANFKDSHNMIFFTDGDAYGQDMLRTLEFGSKASRHLTPDQAFPSTRNPRIHTAGLFPSVGEYLGLPNDIEQKRPMDNKATYSRVMFMKSLGVVDDRDIQAWENNNTYELEALSTFFKSYDGEPIGLPLYLIEYMRYNSIPAKPRYQGSDEDLLNEVKEDAVNHLESEIEGGIYYNSPKTELTQIITKEINEVEARVKTEIMDLYKDQLIADIEDHGTDNIRDRLDQQYQDQPKRQKYSVSSIAAEFVKEVDIKVNWDTEKLAAKIKDAVQEFITELAEDLYTEEITLSEPEEADEIRDFYDVLNDEIGAKPEDAQQVRDALEWRLT